MTRIYYFNLELNQLFHTRIVISHIVYVSEPRYVVCEIATKEFPIIGQDSYRSFGMTWKM